MNVNTMENFSKIVKVTCMYHSKFSEQNLKECEREYVEKLSQFNRKWETTVNWRSVWNVFVADVSYNFYYFTVQSASNSTST